MIFNIYKQRGETPLECIQRFVKENPDLKNDPSNPLRVNKMTYLGRLDPLAEGVLLVGSGEDTTQSRREEFFGLDKEYDFVSIFGFTTDTYDVLGKIMRVEKLALRQIRQAHYKQTQDKNNSTIFENEVRKVTMIYEGEREQEYPPYSSKMFSKNNKKAVPPLLGKERGLGGEVKKITIHKMQFHGLDALNAKELFGRLLMDISKVKGDFRQHEILLLWKEILLKYPDTPIFLGRFSAHVSSGTYIRGIVNDIGNTLGCGATTLSIKRNRVGDYKIEDSIK